jgi:hypothetical protein
MDISEFKHGAKVVLGSAIAFLIISIFNWQEVEFAGIAAAGVSMWHGFGVLVGLLLIVLIVWEGIRLANMKFEIGLSPAMVTTALAVLILVFTILKFLSDNEFRTFWAWLGLLLAIVITVFAFQNMTAAGESLADMKNSMSAAASSAAASAKAASSSAGTAKAAAGEADAAAVEADVAAVEADVAAVVATEAAIEADVAADVAVDAAIDAEEEQK